MKTLFASAIVMMFFINISEAQYKNPNVTIAPYGTTRVQNNINGQTFYDNRGYNGRSMYTGGGSQSLFNRQGQFIGRGQPYGNSYRFTPAIPNKR